MKKHLLAIIFLTSTLFLNAQNTFTYKPNPLTGNLEVFKTSQGNTAYPQKVAEIVKNPLTGYMEIKEFGNQNYLQQSSSEPYTNRPNFDLVKQIKPFKFPYQALIDQITTLNKSKEYDIIQKQMSDKSISQNEKESLATTMKNYFNEMTNSATNLLQFYSSQSKFPKTLPDGYYDAIEIQNQTMFNNNNKGGYIIQVGIAKVQNNKLVEYYESSFDFMSKGSNIFRKFNLSISSSIENCKVNFREDNSNDYRSIYFFDNLLDSTVRIPDPGFGYLTLFTDNLPSDYKKPIGKYSIHMGRNAQISATASEIEIYTTLPYSSAIIYNNNSNRYTCSNSNLTFAFIAKEGKYTILVQNAEKRNGKNDKWYFENLKFTEGNCSSSVLKTN